MLFPKKHGVV
jgi:hypothetical protein